MKRSEKRKLQPQMFTHIAGDDIKTQLIREQIENEILRYDVELYTTMIDKIYYDLKNSGVEVDYQYKWFHDLYARAEKELDEDEKV